MAEAVQVAGVTLVKIDAGSGLSTLGYTRNQADQIFEGYFLDVPGDQNGGDSGPPIEIQYMGEIARIRLELTKYDKAVLQEIQARLNDAVAGTPGTPGTLMFSGSKGYRVVLSNTGDPRNFPVCICRGAVEYGAGTRFSTAVLEFEAHKNGSGVLWNTTIV